jgi:hypothetical protein
LRVRVKGMLWRFRVKGMLWRFRVKGMLWRFRVIFFLLWLSFGFRSSSPTCQ